MNPRDATQAYRRSRVENAPPVQIVRLLYERAIAELERAETKLAAGQVPWSSHTGRAESIVSELRASLDEDAAPELVAELDRLYEFTLARIGDGASRRSTAPLAEARGVLARLLSAWKEIDVGQAGGGKIA